ncbi:hypothetical protein [Alteromonas sp. C1M14]|nr:hypothetical protein [Alteromonas sp. C1M14]MBU2979023.1 hypothetical protein [Alteromonas sp. C1M14]
MNTETHALICHLSAIRALIILMEETSADYTLALHILINECEKIITS